MAGGNYAGIRSIDAGQDAKQCGLTGSIQSDNHHFATTVYGKVNRGKNFLRTVAFAQMTGHEWSLAAWRRIGKLDAGDFILLSNIVETV